MPNQGLPPDYIVMKKNKRIEVAVRMRPLIYEYEDVEAWVVHEDSRKVSSLPRGQPPRNSSHILGEEPAPLLRKKSKVEMNNIYEFPLDYVFKDSQTNQEVYHQCCRQVVEEFLQGSNSTIFMYGQTTSGKTYTMLGDQRTEGLILHSLRDIFTLKDPKSSVNISYLEIYN